MALIHVLYIILEHFSFNIMFCIKSDVITLGGFGDINCIYMDKWVLRGHFYSYMDPVWLLYNIGTSYHENCTGCILGRAPRTKETLPDFR